MTWGGTEKFTTFIDQFLPEFAYTERKGGHLWLALPSRTAPARAPRPATTPDDRRLGRGPDGDIGPIVPPPSAH
jgi:hypothetical protein